MTIEAVRGLRQRLAERPKGKVYNEGEVMISRETIGVRLQALAEKIKKDYEGKDLLMVGVLKGGEMVTRDLHSLLSEDGKQVPLSFMRAKSYQDDTTHTGEVRILQDVDVDIRGKDVLIVDDIFDSGLTLAELQKHLSQEEKGAASVKTLALLEKRVEHKTDYIPDYIGFKIPDEWVEGYGMDSGGNGRENPDIIVRKPQKHG